MVLSLPMLLAFILHSLCISFVYAEKHVVLVGVNNTNTYIPSSLNASVGDTVAFQFVSNNHTATQSTFAKPCQPIASPPGVDSGFLPIDANASTVPEWSITINNTSSPLWFYCKQGDHCLQGMVFAINPTANLTFDHFKATAMGNSASVSRRREAATLFVFTALLVTVLIL